MTYAADARDRYMSLTTIIIIVIFIPLGAGIYFGAVGAAWLIALGYPVKWAGIPASTAALIVFFIAVYK